MPKTLADMTPEQRAACVGMWFDTIFGLGILETLQEEPKEGEPFGRFRHPDRGSWHTESFKWPTPRLDLPRAWAPDGTPTKGEWQRKMEADSLAKEYTAGGDEMQWTHRRFVGEWEPQP